MKKVKALACLLAVNAAPAENTPRLPGLIYRPEGDAIVVRNGTVRDNRPLYCNGRQAFVWAGELPSLSGPMGTLHVGLGRGETRVLLHQFSERVARCRPGRMEWEMTDKRLPGLTCFSSSFVQ